MAVIGPWGIAGTCEKGQGKAAGGQQRGGGRSRVGSGRSTTAERPAEMQPHNSERQWTVKEMQRRRRRGQRGQRAAGGTGASRPCISKPAWNSSGSSCPSCGHQHRTAVRTACELCAVCTAVSLKALAAVACCSHASRTAGGERSACRLCSCTLLLRAAACTALLARSCFAVQGRAQVGSKEAVCACPGGAGVSHRPCQSRVWSAAESPAPWSGSPGQRSREAEGAKGVSAAMAMKHTPGRGAVF